LNRPPSFQHCAGDPRKNDISFPGSQPSLAFQAMGVLRNQSPLFRDFPVWPRPQRRDILTNYGGRRPEIAAPGWESFVGIRILITDDHALVRRGLRALLAADSDWEVCGEASNGLEAVQIAMESQPDVVIMDISMPGLDGLQATRQIREALPQTEVLMLTIHDSREMIRTARKAGARGYIVKTEADRHLIKAMRAVCRRESYFPAG
jgi:CheY-like chemotaxis protein